MKSLPVASISRSALVAAWVVLVGIEVVTQLAFKFAGHATGDFDFSGAAFARAASAPWLWVAVGGYCAGFLAWMLILRHMRLSRAYPASAIVFVAVMVASLLVLGESIATVQWIGATIIVAGILLLGRAVEATSTTPARTNPTE
ncbi:MAG: EamA family transporter [Proteobacteria bacterium]|nr:EamA family transporter [Pseudomonadota bacterium]